MSQSVVAAIEGLIDDLLDRETIPAQTLVQAKALLATYEGDASKGSAWTGLSKSDWCTRLDTLLSEPSLLDQGSTLYCMPAACLFVLFKRAPVLMAGFCVGLASDGVGRLGDLSIEMTQGIRTYGVVQHVTDKLKRIHPVDYVLMLAMQEAMSTTSIERPDSYAAAPGVLVSNMEDLLKATDLFHLTRIDSPKVGDFSNIDGATEAVLVGSMSLFSSAMFGEHAAVWQPPLVENGGQVTLRFWSWGLYQGMQTLPVEGGAYVAQVSVRGFERQLGSVIFVKLK
jgi:hypothetical protein